MLTPTIDFQEATTRDIEALIPLIRAYYEFEEIRFDDTAIRRGLAQFMADRSLGGAWLLVDAGARVGYFVLTYGFALEFGGLQATLTDLYLAPTHRRRGIGASAIGFVEAFLARRGIGALELQVERDNLEAMAFYERLGFEAHDRAPLGKRIGSAPPAR